MARRQRAWATTGMGATVPGTPLIAGSPARPRASPTAPLSNGATPAAEMERIAWRLSELLAMEEMLEEVPAILRRFLYRGSVTILSGAPKSGKSTLMSIIAAHLSGCCDFFTGEPAPQARVLYCSLEEALSRTVQRLDRYGADELYASMCWIGPRSHRSPISRAS